MNQAAAIAHALHARLGSRWSVRALHASGFTATWRAQARAQALFVKSLPVREADVLDAEADGLAALAVTGSVRVPAVVACWCGDAHALLALEWLTLRAPEANFGARLGRALGALHAAPPAERRFGWHRDNRLGATPQRNRRHDEWIDFFAHERLGALRDRLHDAALCDAADDVIRALPRFFADGHVPRPSLIHGDLWSGNWGMLEDGTPVLYDPAVSCSDAEAELAMMELFAAPPAGFWPAYRAVAGVHPGYARRRALYQLYHLLNHALLFGGGYVARSLTLARELAAR